MSLRGARQLILPTQSLFLLPTRLEVLRVAQLRWAARAMRLFIRALDGETLPLEVPSDAKVVALQQALAEKGFFQEEQSLIFGGRRVLLG
eukprot:s2326_g3.t1